MRKSDTIRAEIATLENELQELFEVAQEEQRDFTIAEKNRVDAIQGLGGQNGLLQNAGSELERAIKFETRVEALANDFGNRDMVVRDHRGRQLKCYKRGEPLAVKPKIANALGQYLVAFAGNKRKIHPDIRAALSTGNNQVGGSITPDGFASEVIDLARAQSRVLEAGARIFPMDHGTIDMGVLVQSVTIEMKAENAAFSDGSMQFTNASLVARTFGCYIEASREFIEDAPNAAELIDMELSRQLSVALDYWAINGSSQNINGILTNQRISTTESVGAIDWVDLSNAATRVRVANHAPSAFIMHPSIYEDLSLTTSGDGVNSARQWLSAPPNIANIPQLDTTNCPVTSIVTGDWSKLLWGIRTDATVEASAVAGDTMKKHQVAFKVTFRGDTVIVDPSAFHVLNGITT